MVEEIDKMKKEGNEWHLQIDMSKREKTRAIKRRRENGNRFEQMIHDKEPELIDEK